MPGACKVAVRPVVPGRMPAACKVEAVRRAEDPLAAPRAVVECKAAVLRAATVPQVVPAQWVAAPRVEPAGSRRPGAEPPAVGKARKAAVHKARKGAAVPVAAAR